MFLYQQLKPLLILVLGKNFAELSTKSSFNNGHRELGLYTKFFLVNKLIALYLHGTNFLPKQKSLISV